MYLYLLMKRKFKSIYVHKREVMEEFLYNLEEKGLILNKYHGCLGTHWNKGES